MEDQYPNFGVEMSFKGCSWDAHIAKVMGKGTAHVGRMEAILTDSRLDTINRIKIYILMHVLVPKLGYAHVREGKAKSVNHLEIAHMAAAKKVLRVGCSRTTTIQY